MPNIQSVPHPDMRGLGQVLLGLICLLRLEIVEVMAATSVMNWEEPVAIEACLDIALV